MHRSVWLCAAIGAVAGLCLAAPTLADATTFSNPATITIPAGAPAFTSGKADPYPSTIDVSGLTGTISNLTVTLTGFSHALPQDVGVLLVGPTGANVVLMDGPGGNVSASGLTFTFDDSAASSLACGANTLVSGTYKPNACYSGDVWPPPAPSGSYGSLLSGFNGTDANGTWSLYVNDFAGGPGTVGSIANGWSLTITTEALAVTVASFTAKRAHKGVIVRWRTGTEADELGFDVYRQEGNRRVRVNRRLLPALGGVSGHSYSFVDRRAPRHSAVRYWLQDVSTSGVRTWHEPVRVAAA